MTKPMTQTYIALPANAAVLENFFNREDMLHVLRLVTMGQLTASFAHEVNNALSLIEGSLIVARELLPPGHPALTHLAVISRSEKHIDAMSKRMLEFGRTRASHPKPHDIKEVVDEAIELMQPQFRSNNLIVTVDIPSWLPKMCIDRWQIMQAVVNLLRNACDAMAKSSRRHVSITVVQERDDVRISVSDAGSGISTENLSKIFIPFFSTKGDRGTGLGLYVTKNIVEEHCGTIVVDSSPDGTTFTISLPLLQGNGASYSP